MDPDPELFFTITSIMYKFTSGAEIIILLMLLILSALISGTEVSFFSLSKADLSKLNDDSGKENLIVTLLKHPKKLLATILITNNFINILIVLLFTSLDFFGNIHHPIKYFGFSIKPHYYQFALEVVLVTFLILLFGEVLPKVYASRKALDFSRFMSRPMRVLTILLTIPSKILASTTSLIEKRLGNKVSNFSVETLSQALELTSDEATTKNEQKILEGIVNFGNTETVQIMKPRIDIFALSDSETYPMVLKKILKNGYSRNPVYKDSIDNIIGVLYSKDLLGHLEKKDLEWKNILREPSLVPENKKQNDIL